MADEVEAWRKTQDMADTTGEERRAEAEALLRDGKTATEVRAALREKFGVGMGNDAIVKIRKGIDKPATKRQGPSHASRLENLAKARQVKVAGASTFEKRLAQGEVLMRRGLTHRDIVAALEKQFGYGLGGGTLTRLRAKLKREAKRAARQAARAAVPGAVAASATGVVRIAADPAVLTALVAAKVAFAFDGECIALTPR